MTARADPGVRAQMGGRRLTEPLEAVAQHVARQAVELVVEALDVNALLDQVDINQLLDRVDVNAILDRVDVNRLIARADVNAILDRVDVDRLAARVDVDALLERTELRSVLSRSSSTIASEGIDLVRSQAVGLDDFIARWASRLRRRSYSGPPALPGSPTVPGSPSLQAGQ